MSARTTLAVLLMLVVTVSVAGSEPTMTFWYNNALRIIVMPDGAHFLIVATPVSNDPYAITAVEYFPRTKIAWRRHAIAKGLRGVERTPNLAGQVLGAVMTPNGKHLFLSGRYLDEKHLPKNVILKFKRTPSGDWRPLGVVTHVTEVGDIALTDDGSIVAVTFDQERSDRRGSPSLTLFSGNGVKLGEFFTQPHGLEGAPLTIRGRLQALGNDRFAFHDGLSPQLHFFDVAHGRLENVKSVEVEALANGGDVDNVRGWHVNDDDSVTVVRHGRRGDGGCRVVRMANGEEEQRAVPACFRSVFWEGDELWAVRAGVEEELAIDHVAVADLTR